MSRNAVSPAPNYYGLDRPLSSTSKTELFRAESSTPKPILAESNKFKKKEPIKKKPKKKDNPSVVKLKRFARFFVKKFGMLIGTVIYCMGGASLFNILEAQNELAGCEGSQSDSQALIQDYQMKIFNYLNFNVTFNPALVSMTADNDTKYLDGPAVYNKVIHEWLIELRDEVLSNGYGGEDCEVVNSWQFLSGLLWTMTVVTSIGYGHTSPSTWEGQIVLICYALLGMPLFLLTCAEISVMLADFFVFMYKNFFCLPCNIYSQYKLMKEDDEEEEIIVDEEGIPEMEDPDDYTKKQEDYSDPKSDSPIEDNNEAATPFNDDGEEEEEAVRVPLVIIMGTLFAFLLGGGYLFQYLEEWDVILGVYFTFISISSVGFGDYSPGTTDMGNGHLLKASRNLLIGTIFLVIGMSILGMCFSLMADGLVDNFKLMFERLGIMKEEEEEIGEGYIGMIGEEEDCTQAQSNVVKLKSLKKGAPKAGEEFKNKDESSSSESDDDEPKYMM